MKRRLCLLLFLLLASFCSGCTALPAEERAFAVALGVEEHAGTWEVSARVPTYQQSGGYLTLTAQGGSLGEALAILDASSPMQLHLGQLRLVIFSRSLAETEKFIAAMRELALRPEMRLQAAVCITEDRAAALLEALEPSTGSRLSKSLEVLLEARTEQGVIPAMTLSDALRRGERQSWVAVNVALEDAAQTAQPGMDASAGAQAASGAGKVHFGGGWLIGQDGVAHGQLTAGETQYLALMQGQLQRATLALEEGTVTMIGASAQLRLTGNTANLTLKLRCAASVMTEEGIQQSVFQACQRVLDKLAAANCDALGVARQAILRCPDMAAWNELDWPAVYPQLEWRLTVLPRQTA